MNENLLGYGLMILGVVLFFIGRWSSKTSKNSSVSAANGSVAVGGNNSGPIINTNTGANPAAKAQGHSGHTITVVAIVVEIVGIAVTIWHASHMMAAK